MRNRFLPRPSQRRSRNMASIGRSLSRLRSKSRVANMQNVEVKVPDIGEFTDVDVIELLVKPGDTVNVDDPLIAIESEKATMEVPAPSAGVVKELKVKLGDKVSEGSIILVLEAETASSAPDGKTTATPEAKAPAPG